jgi:CIC family chloride channel protein
LADSAQQGQGGNPARRAWQAVVRYFRRLRSPDQLAMFILALVLGVAAAYGTIGFRWIIDQVQWGFLGSEGEHLLSLSTTLPRWQILLAPCAGGLLIGLFIRYAMPDRRPLGVADVIEANALKGGRLSLTSGLLAAVTSAASVGVGASVGREGPVVHLGASMAAWVAKRLRLSRAAGVTLLGCGVAAAVAASFNAPIAGVFFALEVVVGHYALSAFAPIVIASVVGTVISRSHYGDFPAFILPEYAIASVWEFAVFALLGVASAAAAMMLMRAIMNVQDLAARIPGPAWLHPAMGGLLVGAIALVFPQVLGVGYETTDLALKGQFGLQILLLLFAAKILATAISLGMGFGGGVFSPSLVVGALLGGVFGSVMAGVYPALASSTGAYAMVGMGAVAGAVLGAPISTILIIFELTGDYRVTIAVMVAVVIASLITQAFRVKSFFIWQLERRGIDVSVGRERGMLRSMQVRDVMVGDYATIAPDAPVAELRSKLLSAPYGLLMVVGAGGRLEGTVALSDLGEVAFDNSLDDLVKAGDAARRRTHVIEAGENLDAAWKLCTETDEARFPVVESRESMIVVGLLRERDVMLAYHQALLQTRAEERGEA